MRRYSRKDATEKAMELLLYRPRSEFELRTRLTEAEYEEDEVTEAIEYVRSYGYINDREFAYQYAAAYGESKGRNTIRFELKKKGVAEELIEDALAELPEDETEKILALLERRAGEPHRLDEKEYRRYFAYFARRGFSYSDFRKAVAIYAGRETGTESANI